MGICGINVSEYQGIFDWNNIKHDGTDFAMLRAGYGDGVIDQQFRRNAQSCSDRKIPFGVYWISYAYTSEMAKKEAKQCVETIEEFEIKFPVCVVFTYDLVRYAESKNCAVTKELLIEWAISFCKKAEELGYKAIYYINLEKYEKDIFIKS